MGDYTGIRLTATLSSRGMRIMEYVRELREWPPEVDIPQSFREDPRAHFIPFGALAYMPDDWENAFSLDRKTMEMVLCCATKHCGLVLQFRDEVLPLLLAQPCQVEVLDELWAKSEIKKVFPPDWKPSAEEAIVQRAIEAVGDLEVPKGFEICVGESVAYMPGGAYVDARIWVPNA